jgi:hypothetical protein
MYYIKVTEIKVVDFNVAYILHRMFHVLGTYIWLAWLVVLLLPYQEDLYTFHILFLYGMK